MQPFNEQAAQLAHENSDYRRVLYTTNHSQLVLMALQTGQEIPQEKHDVDQIFIIVHGEGEALINNETVPFAEGSTLIIPAGTVHTIKNTGADSLKLYTFYAPPEHPQGTIHKTQQDDPEMQ